MKLDSVEAMRLKLASGPRSRAPERARRQVRIPAFVFASRVLGPCPAKGGGSEARGKRAGRGFFFANVLVEGTTFGSLRLSPNGKR